MNNTTCTWCKLYQHIGINISTQQRSKTIHCKKYKQPHKIKTTTHLQKYAPPSDEIENLWDYDSVPSLVLDERALGVVRRTCPSARVRAGHGPRDVVRAAVALDLDIEGIDGAHVDVLA